MAKPIVNGIPEQTNNSVEVIHLNLLVGAGREAASTVFVWYRPRYCSITRVNFLTGKPAGRMQAT
jgi:hypothetical protein